MNEGAEPGELDVDIRACASAAMPSAKVSGRPPTCLPACRHVRARRRWPGRTAPTARRPSSGKQRSAVRTAVRDRRAAQVRAASRVVHDIGRGAKRYCAFSCQCNCCRMPRIAGNAASRGAANRRRGRQGPHGRHWRAASRSHPQPTEPTKPRRSSFPPASWSGCRWI